MNIAFTAPRVAGEAGHRRATRHIVASDDPISAMATATPAFSGRRSLARGSWSL
jgi:hypothetical protein